MTPDEARLILHRLDQQDAQLQRIENHARQTNGRVTSLELWRARIDGFRTAVSPLLIAVGTLATSTLTGVLVYVLTRG